MSVWGRWKLEVILEIAVSMEGWAPAGLQQVLASSPHPHYARLRLVIYYFMMGIPGEVQSRGWGCWVRGGLGQSLFANQHGSISVF